MVDDVAGAAASEDDEGRRPRAALHRPQNLAGEVSLAEVNRIFQARATDLAPADQPVVLIAQPTRSGGTLLSQLCDGHPQLHVHPYELEIGYPDKSSWPEIHLSESPNRWFNMLLEPHVVASFRRGYGKDVKGARVKALGLKQGLERFPFLLVPSYQRALFMALVKQFPPESARDVLSAYFTAYFNAWLDNQNLTGTEKRWVVGFRSGLGTPENLESFFGDYADGRHLTSVREPKGWIASHMRLWDENSDRTLDDYIGLWNRLTTQRIEAKQRYGTAVFLCSFERLVTETETVMRGVASWLGIAYDSGLNEPTFNRRPIRANSSFDVDSHGVIAAPLQNWRQVLSQEDAVRIDELTGDVHQLAASLAEGELRPTTAE